MDVTLTRYYQDRICTLGVLKINNSHPPIYTMERPWMDNERDISCIPAGTYQVEPYSSAKFKDVYEIKNVPNRTAILIHSANRPSELKGCVAPGLGVAPQIPMVSSSVLALEKIKEIIGKRSFTLHIKEM